MLEDYSVVVPTEEQFDLAQEMLSETDWAMPLKTLQANTKDLFYSYFGQVPKAPAATANKDEEM